MKLVRVGPLAPVDKWANVFDAALSLRRLGRQRYFSRPLAGSSISSRSFLMLTGGWACFYPTAAGYTMVAFKVYDVIGVVAGAVLDDDLYAMLTSADMKMDVLSGFSALGPTSATMFRGVASGEDNLKVPIIPRAEPK